MSSVSGKQPLSELFISSEFLLRLSCMFLSHIVIPSADIHLVFSLIAAARPSRLMLSNSAGIGPICHMSAFNTPDRRSRTLKEICLCFTTLCLVVAASHVTGIL